MESLEEKRKRFISMERQERENVAYNPDWAKELREEMDELEAEIYELKANTAERGIQLPPTEDKVNKIQAKKPTKPDVTDRKTIVDRTNDLVKMLRDSRDSQSKKKF